MKIDKEILKSKINLLKNPKILVIGDFAIDEMIYGNTERISREAPVLILLHSNTKFILGAASNAAHNVSVLNDGKVSVIGVYGDDYHAPIMFETFKKAKIDTQYMVKDKNRATTVKTRISGSCSHSITQQIVRIDRQTSTPLSKETEDKIIENMKKAIPLHDAVILSDYNIGCLTKNIIEAATKISKENNKIIIVDAQQNLDRYKNVTALKPNQPDTEKFVGLFIKDEETLQKAGKIMLEKTNADKILITRGGEGMAIFNKEGEKLQVPAFNKKEVFDVTGAGDTVVATFTLALAAGLSDYEAMLLGNLAASIVIRSFGCATTTLNKLQDEIDKIEI